MDLGILGDMDMAGLASGESGTLDMAMVVMEDMGLECVALGDMEDMAVMEGLVPVVLEDTEGMEDMEDMAGVLAPVDLEVVREQQQDWT